jgi:hypothetical protein
MPDDDRLPRTLTGYWRRVFKAFRAEESAEAIEYHVARATAETLRRAHGIPDLPVLGANFHRAVTSDVPGSPSAGPSSRSPHIPTRIAVRAVDVMPDVLGGQLSRPSPKEAAIMLTRRVVAEVAFAAGLDRMAPALIEDGQDPGKLYDRFRAAVSGDLLEKLAARLLAHPDGSGLVAPGRARPKVTTADLMDIDLMDMR